MSSSKGTCFCDGRKPGLSSFVCLTNRQALSSLREGAWCRAPVFAASQGAKPPGCLKTSCARLKPCWGVGGASLGVYGT